MKKHINLISLLTGACAVLLAGCVAAEAERPIPGRGEGIVQLSVSLPDASRADAEEYDALSLSTLRLYKLESDEQGGKMQSLIRKYKPATEVPADLYLAAGEYKVAVEAGDDSEATFVRKSYAGEETFTLEAHDVKPLPVVCKIRNIAVRVVFDATVGNIFDGGHVAYVSASDDFSKTDAENDIVPTLRYTSDATGYFMLPEGTQHLSWGFYGTSSDPDIARKSSRTGRIEFPQGGMQYTLTFKYSKDAEGELSVSVQVREWESSHDDNFNFSPQPTISGSGFNISRPTGYHSNPVVFKVSSINPLSSLTFTAAGVQYSVLSGGVAAEGIDAQGITYERVDDCNGTLSLDGTFFSRLSPGINPIDFIITDTDRSEGKATARVAIAGATGMVAPDLWFGTAAVTAVVTNPDANSITIGYRLSGTEEWTDLEGTPEPDGYTYTAPAVGFKADKTYEFRVMEDGVQSGGVLTLATERGVQLPNAGFEEWHQSGKPWYPYASGGTEFWGTGNPGATTAGADYNLTTGVEDPRPGSSGRLAAKLETKKPSFVGIGKLAAGNLFVGAFGEVSGMGGTVKMGRAFEFNGRPTAMRLWHKYTPVGGDKGRIYVCLVKMTNGDTYHVVDTNNAAKTTFSPDDEFLYSDKTNPATLQGHIIGYGDLLLDSSVSQWTEVTIPITYRDNYSGEKPNVLIITAAASYRGDYFEGEIGSTMYVDDIEFVY